MAQSVGVSGSESHLFSPSCCSPKFNFGSVWGVLSDCRWWVWCKCNLFFFNLLVSEVWDWGAAGMQAGWAVPEWWHWALQELLWPCHCGAAGNPGCVLRKQQSCCAELPEQKFLNGSKAYLGNFGCSTAGLPGAVRLCLGSWALHGWWQIRDFLTSTNSW